MLKRAHITGYKSLRDAEIVFADPLSLIIGPNAAGKTNLLDALTLLSRIMKVGNIEEAFEQEHRGSYLEAFSLDETGIAGLMAQPEREMRFEIDVELSPSTIQPLLFELTGSNSIAPEHMHMENLLRYSLHIRTRDRGRELVVSHEQLVALDESGKPKEGPIPFLMRRTGSDSAMYKVYQGQETVENIIGMPVNEVVAASRFSTRDHYQLIALQREVAHWRFYNLATQQMQQDAPYRGISSLPSDGKDLAAFFDTVKTKNPKKFNQIYRELSIIVPQIDEFDVVPTEDARVKLKVRENGIEFSSQVISEGTLRVLGMLALSSPLEPVTLIGLEEPENGIHPRRLELVAHHFRNLARKSGIQILLTSHSPLMPEYFAPEQVIVCKRRRNATTFVPLREAGVFPLPEYETPDEDEEPTSLHERILRGDYGG